MGVKRPSVRQGPQQGKRPVRARKRPPSETAREDLMGSRHLDKR